MTEAEWLACDDPQPMLDIVQDKASDRKLQLFAVACCRRVRHHWADERPGIALNVAERYPGGVGTNTEREGAKEMAEDAALALGCSLREAEAAETGTRDRPRWLPDPSGSDSVICGWSQPPTSGGTTQ